MIEALAETGAAPQLSLMIGDTSDDRTMAKAATA
jgi:phosphoglycolate phosphatase-like HAD superfamily hydrolase